MNKTMLLATTAAIALAAGRALAGSHPALMAEPANLHRFPATVGVLYDQNSNFGEAIVSQNFVSGDFMIYNSAAADDFVVPANHKWDVTEVDVTGAYFNGSGPAESEVVTFYTDRKGYPNKEKTTYTLNCADARGSFACTIPGRGKILSGGIGGKSYWVSVVANCDFGNGCGDWGWVQNTKIRKYEGVWENPENGYGTGCTSWGRNSACLGLPGDYAFILKGKKL